MQFPRHQCPEWHPNKFPMSGSQSQKPKDHLKSSVTGTNSLLRHNCYSGLGKFPRTFLDHKDLDAQWNDSACARAKVAAMDSSVIRWLLVRYKPLRDWIAIR